MYKSFLSWRYLIRRPVNLIGIGGILVGVGALILILSIMTGFLETTRKTVRGNLADLIIEPADRPLRSGAELPRSPDKLLEAVRADPRVAGACAQLTWFGILAPMGEEARFSQIKLFDPQNAGRAGVQLVGIDAQDEFQVSSLREALVREPRRERVADPDDPFAPPPGYEPDGRPLASVIVGEALARAFDLSRGSELMVLTGVPSGSEDFKPSNRRFIVAGTFRTQDNETDLSRLYVDRRELIDLLGAPREFSQVLLRLKNYEQDGAQAAEELHKRLIKQGLLAGYTGEVRTWEEFRGVLLAAIENEKVLMAIMLSLVLLVAGFTIYAILSMMVTEKRRDIGILCALGADPRGIQGLFLMIGIWDAILGTIIGTTAGILGAIYIDSIERGLSKLIGVQIFNRDVYLFDHIPSVVEPWSVVWIVSGAFACTLLFAFWPAWRASRLNPIDALRYE